MAEGLTLNASGRTDVHPYEVEVCESAAEKTKAKTESGIKNRKRKSQREKLNTRKEYWKFGDKR